jgi:hypothetical protein
MPINQLNYLGAGSFNLVYRISETKVLRIYIYPLLQCDAQYRLSYAILKRFYDRFKDTEEIINKELKTFTPIEMMNVRSYDIESDTTGEFAIANRIFSFYLIAEWHHTFSINEYMAILTSPLVVCDILNVKRDLKTLFSHNYAYADFKYPNFLLHKVTKRLLIGDIDVDLIDNLQFLVSTYRFDNENLRTYLLETKNCFRSVCYLNLLMFVINIFFHRILDEEEYYLQNLLNKNRPAFRILYMVEDYANIHLRYGKLNILNYDNLWEFVLCVYLKYLYEEKLEQVNIDFPEFVFVQKILSEESTTGIIAPESLGKPATDALKFKSTDDFRKLLNALGEWSETKIKTLDFSAYENADSEIVYDFNLEAQNQIMEKKKRKLPRTETQIAVKRRLID